MKGGVSKSTIAFNLAFTYAQSLEVVVIDTDLQSSVSQLLQDNEKIKLMPLPKEITAIRNIKADVVIIDTPGYLSVQLPEILKLSDIVLIPTKAGFWDFTALKSMITVVNIAKQYNTKLKWGVVLTMVTNNSKLSKEIKGLIEELQVPIFKTQITQRVSYVRSLIMGGILNTDDLKAKTEIIELADEIITVLE